MKISEIPCPFASDDGMLKTIGIVGAAHAAALIIAPAKMNDKMHVKALDSDYPADVATVTAGTRITGVLAGAAAVTALALATKDDNAVARRAALAANGLGLVGVAAIQGVETHKERNNKRIGWAATGVHAGLGALCLYRGLKEGLPK